MAVGPVRTALGEEYCMPGQEHPAAHARVADSDLPDASATPASGSLASWANRPAAAGRFVLVASEADGGVAGGASGMAESGTRARAAGCS